MEKKKSPRRIEYAFRTCASFCTYGLTRGKNEILLEGKEAENGKTTFRLTLNFSSEEAKAVERFARTLADTQTMPRMMAELAEEYFFD